jgi:hypothetical protein
MKNYIGKFPEVDSNKLLIFSFFFIGSILFYLEFRHMKTAESVEVSEDAKSADTYIPKGFVLVPIEIANSESLNSLIGEVGGLVDLYLVNNHEGQKQTKKKIASRIKIIKAPLNPQQYAVLVKESESASILTTPGPFIAVIQNPESGLTEIMKTQKPEYFRVEYQN